MAQAAREMIAGGDIAGPDDGGPPLARETPPGDLAGRAVGPAGRRGRARPSRGSRRPSPRRLLALGTATLAARRFGATAGLLAGLVQATTAWTVIAGPAGRGRHAPGLPGHLDPAGVRPGARRGRAESGPASRRRAARLAAGFWLGLGLSALVKGIGFGAALVGVTVVLVAGVGPRPAGRSAGCCSGAGCRSTGRWRRRWPWPGRPWCCSGIPSALGFWTWHLAGRLAERPEHFASGPWWQYGPALLGQVLPWTPLALVGAGRSLVRAARPGRGRSTPAAGDRLLWAWAVGPVALLSLATVKNAHYIIHALPPWSIWAALSLLRLGGRLRASRLDGRSARGASRRSASRGWGWPAAWASRCSAPGSTAGARGRSGPSTRTRAVVSGRASRWPCSTTTGTASPTPPRSARCPHDLARPPLLPRPPRLLAVRRRRPGRAAARRPTAADRSRSSAATATSPPCAAWAGSRPWRAARSAGRGCPRSTTGPSASTASRPKLPCRRPRSNDRSSTEGSGRPETQGGV